MDESPFAKLSPELRNIIFGLAVTHDKEYWIVNKVGVKILKGPETSTGKRIETAKLELGQNLLGLAKTCKAIHNECVGVFYAKNDFRFGSERVFQVFCTQIGEANAAALRSVTVFCIHGSFGVTNPGVQIIDDLAVEVATKLPKCRAKLVSFMSVRTVNPSYAMDLRSVSKTLAERLRHFGDMRDSFTPAKFLAMQESCDKLQAALNAMVQTASLADSAPFSRYLIYYRGRQEQSSALQSHTAVTDVST